MQISFDPSAVVKSYQSGLGDVRDIAINHHSVAILWCLKATITAGCHSAGISSRIQPNAETECRH